MLLLNRLSEKAPALNSRVLRNAKSKLAVVEAGVVAPIAMYGIYLVATDGGKVEEVRRPRDTKRGVWNAPARLDAALGVNGLQIKLTDVETSELNTSGINRLRSFPVRIA